MANPTFQQVLALMKRDNPLLFATKTRAKKTKAEVRRLYREKR